MKGKNIKPFLYCILFCCLLFCTACGKEKILDYEYEYTSTNLRVEEDGAIFLTDLHDVIICRREYANYYFDKDSSLELRNTYVESSEKILQFVMENVGFTDKLEIYAANGMYYYNSETGKCALGLEYAKTSLQAALLIQAITGSATVNYGLLQAEGFSIARLLGWDISYVPPITIANNEDFAHPLAGKRYEFPEVNKKKRNSLAEVVRSLEEENQFLLDLEYLCFSPNYVEEKQVEYAWTLARSLSEYISENNKEQEVLFLLTNNKELLSFEEEFTKLRNAWLLECGSTMCISAREYPIHYGNYGRFAFFQMETLHGKWYVRSSFDTSVNGEYSLIFHRDYQETNLWMQQFEEELAYVDKVLRDKTFNYPELKIYLDGDDYMISQGFGGYYDIKHNDQIYVGKLYGLVHEYCHYLLLQEGVFVEDGVSKETYITQLHLLPYYYGSHSKMAYLLFQETYKSFKKYYANDEKWDNYFLKLEEKFDGEVLICDEEGTKQFMHFLSAIEGMDKSVSKLVTKQGFFDYSVEEDALLYSFSIFIAKTYGEDILYLVATGNDRVEELTGHTYKEFAEEWEEYLKKSYEFY